MNGKSLEFKVEPLEGRKLLAGNVDVEVTPAGDVRITGDNESNQISIEFHRPFYGASFSVRPTGDTRINGATGTHDFDIPNSAVRDLRVNLRGGDDAIRFQEGFGNFPFPWFRHGAIIGGSGNDQITFSLSNRIEFERNLRILLGPGDTGSNPHGGLYNQEVSLNSMDVGGKLTVVGSRTNDLVQLNSFNELGRATVSVGGGTDFVHAQATLFDSRTRINLGSGSDLLTLTSVTINNTFTAIGGAGFDAFVSTGHSGSDPQLRGFES